MDATIYSTEGKKSGTVNLPENIFGVRWNADLVKQVADSLLSSQRKPVAPDTAQPALLSGLVEVSLVDQETTRISRERFLRR